MKTHKKIYAEVLLVALLIFGAALAKNAYAMTPSVSVSYSGSSDLVQINVTGDANAGVGLYFSGTSGLQVQALGNMNSNGSLSTTISSGQYGIVAGSSVYVVVNGQQSTNVTWPSYSSTGGSGTLSVSQTSVVMAVGQSSTVTVYNNSGNSLYVSNNSNPVVANVNLSGNQITLTANNQGSTVFTVCSIINTSNCVSVYVTVQNSGAQSLTFSQSNVTVAAGQSVPITITGGTGVYTVLNNSNSSVIQANISGSVLNLSTNSTSGSATLTVCSSNLAGCGIINVTVGTVSSSGVTFSQTNPTIAVGQTTPIILYGGYNYSVSSNSNPSVIQSTISDSTLTLFGVSGGSATITVCSSTGGCGTVTVTVTGTNSGGPIALSQNALSLLVGQTLSVTISGGSMPYNLPAYSTNVFQASLNGNVITVSGLSNGTSLLTVCSSSGGCTTLSVSVNTNGTNSSGGLMLGQSSVTVGIGQSTSISISGGGGYYISSNSNPNVATVVVNSSSLVVSGTNSGTSNVAVCQTGGQCATLFITISGNSTNTTPNAGGALAFSQAISVGQSVKLLVSGGASSYYISSNTSNIVSASINGSLLTLTGTNPGSDSVNICSTGSTCSLIYVTVNPSGINTPAEPTTPSTPTVSGVFKFLNPLYFGLTNNDVTELQKRLTNEGVYSGPITGYYGNLTVEAVKTYQGDHNLTPLGNVGPSTRALLNE